MCVCVLVLRVLAWHALGVAGTEEAGHTHHTPQSSDDVGVLHHLAVVVSHGLDELGEPDGHVHRESLCTPHPVQAGSGWLLVGEQRQQQAGEEQKKGTQHVRARAMQGE